MANNKFWLYDWIDSYEIFSFADAVEIIKHPAPLKDLRERIAQVPSVIHRLPTSDAPTIIAGRAIDLSGSLDCIGWSCIKKQVDKLFSHVWHYFERIVVVGPNAAEISEAWNVDTERQIVKMLLTYIRLLLYIREIGAEDLLIFRYKFPACDVHLEDHLEEVGMQSALMLAEGFIEQLAEKAEIETQVHEEHIHYKFVHPEFEHYVSGAVHGKEATRSNLALRHAVTTSVYRKYLAHLASDIRMTKTWNAPLGSTVNFHGQLLKTFKAGLGEGDIAFNLELPILKGIKPADLLRIRQDEKIHFERFRHSIRIAIKERLENSTDNNADAIALEIRRDVIDPALNDIERRLAAAKRVLAKKAGLSITIGALATTCGLLTANPLLLTTGIGTAVGGALNAEYKFIEEQRDLTLSDMYFLWKAAKHRKHVMD